MPTTKVHGLPVQLTSSFHSYRSFVVNSRKKIGWLYSLSDAKKQWKPRKTLVLRKFIWKQKSICCLSWRVCELKTSFFTECAGWSVVARRTGTHKSVGNIHAGSSVVAARIVTVVWFCGTEIWNQLQFSEQRKTDWAGAWALNLWFDRSSTLDNWVIQLIGEIGATGPVRIFVLCFLAKT